MSLPLVALPSAAAAPLAQQLQVHGSADALERFDLLAQGGSAESALRLAVERAGAVHALVLAAAAPPDDPTLAERVAALKVPALTVLGTRDPQVPPAAGRRWRALLPGCHLIFLYDAGHDFAADRPQAFAHLVLDFLSEPEAFVVNRRDGRLHP